MHPLSSTLVVDKLEPGLIAFSQAPVPQIEQGYSEGSSDLRAQITGLRNGKPEVIVVISYPSDTIIAVKQLGALNVGVPLYFQTEAVEDAGVMRDAHNDLEGVTYILPAPASGVTTEQFKQAFLKEFRHDPNTFAAESYDMALLILKAMQGSGLSGTSIKDYLYQIRDYPGASGSITFDHNGDVAKPMAIKRIVGGQPVIIETK